MIYVLFVGSAISSFFNSSQKKTLAAIWCILIGFLATADPMKLTFANFLLNLSHL